MQSPSWWKKSFQTLLKLWSSEPQQPPPSRSLCNLPACPVPGRGVRDVSCGTPGAAGAEIPPQVWGGRDLPVTLAAASICRSRKEQSPQTTSGKGSFAPRGPGAILPSLICTCTLPASLLAAHAPHVLCAGGGGGATREGASAKSCGAGGGIRLCPRLQAPTAHSACPSKQTASAMPLSEQGGFGGCFTESSLTRTNCTCQGGFMGRKSGSGSYSV